MQGEYRDVVWTTLSPPLKPFIRATINPICGPNQTIISGDLVSETYASTGLTVQNGSVLIMVCLANFFVKWFKDNATVPLEQSATFNPTLDPWAPWWTDDKTKNQTRPSQTILAIPGYSSILNFGAVTVNQSGTYACRYPGSNEEYFTTAIKLSVDCSPAPTNNSSEPMILQTGFDVIEILDTSQYTIDLALIYFEPIDLECNKYLLSPNGVKHEPNESDEPLIPWKPRQKITWEIDWPYKDQQTYHMVIEYRSKNGSLMQKKHSFKIYVIIQETIRQNVDRVWGKFRTYLSFGRVYEIDFEVHGQLRLVVLETTIETSVLDPPDRNCADYNQVPSNMAYEKCGIIGVRNDNGFLIENNKKFDLLGKIAVVINVTRFCRLSVEVILNGTDYLTQIATLDIVALQNIFDNSLSGQPIIQPEPSVISGIPMVTNQTLSLRCIVSACDWERIHWCKRGTDGRGGMCVAKWSHDRIKEYTEGNMTEDPRINVSYNLIDYLTGSYDITFLGLQLYHGGRWSCVTGQNANFATQQQIIEMDPTSDIYFTVKDPILPVFLDGKEFLTLNKILEKNGQIELFCNVTGFPLPTLTWWRLDKNCLINKGNNSNIIQVQEPGDYECKAENGYGEISRKFIVRYYEGGSILAIAISIPALGLVILVLIGILIWRKRQAKAILFKELVVLLQQQPPDNMVVDTKIPLNDQTYILSYNQHYEIQRHFFKMTNQIGQGQFGKVFKGELKPEGNSEAQLVAVKVPRDSTNLEHFKDLIAELKIMTFIDAHVNVVSLVGACTTNIENNYQMYVLTEFCVHGSLKDYLTKHWPTFESLAVSTDGTGSMVYSSTIDPLLNYAYQAANGMKYLALKNIIHRDLALRNLLLSSGQIVKIADFGMSRHHQTIYQKQFSESDLVPIRWMALESIINGQYTQKSDVWSFGVVLWEIFSCQIPYAQQGLGNVSTFIAWLKNGRRMEKPKIAPDELYKLMLDCWNGDPTARPTFSDCERRIDQNLKQKSPIMYATVQKILSDAWRNISAQSKDASASAREAETLGNCLYTDFNEDSPIDFAVNQSYMEWEDKAKEEEKETNYEHYLVPVQRKKRSVIN